MLTRNEALDRAQNLIDLAIRAGATAADCIYAASTSSTVAVRLGQLEDVQRSEGAEIGLRTFVGKKSATASSSDLSSAALGRLVERTLAMARLAPEDAFAGLAPDSLLAVGAPPELSIDDGGEVDPAVLREAARAVEDAARSVMGVTNSEGGSASAGHSTTVLVTSHGFAGAYSGSSHGLSASVLAGEGSSMQRDYAHHSSRYRTDLEDPQDVGRRAGERAAARLAPQRLKSGPMPIVFDPRVGGSLLGHFAGAITGSAIARKTSFLRDRLLTQVFSDQVTIVDDPLRIRGLRSRPFDGEGLRAVPATLIRSGVLEQWMADSASARQIGIEPTGHAARGVSGAPGVSPTNLHMCPGDATSADLMADIVDGFYVNDLIGMGVNPITGDYSRGASGRRIVNGELTGPVAEVTIAGNLLAMFASIIPANDLEFRYAINVPTLRIDGMTLAGD